MEKEKEDEEEEKKEEKEAELHAKRKKNYTWEKKGRKRHTVARTAKRKLTMYA